MQFVPYLLFVFVTVNCLTMSIVSGKEVCIWEEGKIGDQLYASYEVTKGESNNMKVSVVSCLPMSFVDQKRSGSYYICNSR